MNLKLFLLFAVLAAAPSKAYIDGNEENPNPNGLQVCMSEERQDSVTALVTDYVSHDKIPFMEALGIRTSWASEREKGRMVVDLLAKHGLPPLPPCFNVTSNEIVHFGPEITETATSATDVTVHEVHGMENNKTSKLPVEVSNMDAEQMKKVCFCYLKMLLKLFTMGQNNNSSFTV